MTLLGAALDRTALPRYGPVLASGREAVTGAEEALGEVPPELGEAWWRGACRSEDGCLLLVDRRLVSIECKRALEGMQGLELRQGIACDLGVLADDGRGVTGGRRPPVGVRTVFGEELEATAVVVAAGWALGEGGGETEGDRAVYRGSGARTQGLTAALDRLGAQFATCVAEVGPRYGWWRAGRDRGTVMKVLRREARRAGLAEELVLSKVDRVPKGLLQISSRSGKAKSGGASLADEGNEGQARGSWPESPYEDDELWGPDVLLAKKDGRLSPAACADGVATGELCVSPGWVDDWGDSGEYDQRLFCEGLSLSRRGRTTRGGLVVGLGEGGRLQGGREGELPVWITGRAGGAGDYVDSLASGTKTGLSLLEFLQ